MLLITPLVASLLALFFVRLTWQVIGLRRKHKVSLGTGGHADLEMAIRAHGNFAEYVPLGLVLLACLEFNNAPATLVWVLGILLAAGRIVHALGVTTPSAGASKNRVRGMVLTILTLSSLAVCNIGWLVYRTAGS